LLEFYFHLWTSNVVPKAAPANMSTATITAIGYNNDYITDFTTDHEIIVWEDIKRNWKPAQPPKNWGDFSGKILNFHVFPIHASRFHRRVCIDAGVELL
jgi:hypothetical protein